MNLLDLKGRLAALNEDNGYNKIHEYINIEEIEELVDVIGMYQKVLIFYATDSTYQHDKWGSPIERDSGELARNTLEIGEVDEKA